MTTHYNDLYRPNRFGLAGCDSNLESDRDSLSRNLDKAQREKAAAHLHLQKLVWEVRTLRSERDDALRALESATHNTIFEMARAAEQKDGETGHHLRRIGVISGMIAEAMGFDEAFCDLLCRAAQLHDIGKVGIPDSILRKTEALTIDEWRLMREHARIGAGILSAFQSPLVDMAREICLSHHERYSGGGYPAGLAGKTIPLVGRIVALADFFDSLTMDRSYRKALPDGQVLAMIAERSGEHFDPHIVAVFMSIADQIVLARDSINEIEAICDLPDSYGDWWMAF